MNMKLFFFICALVIVNAALGMGNPQGYTGCRPNGCFSGIRNGQGYGCGPNGCRINSQQPKINVQPFLQINSGNSNFKKLTTSVSH